MGVGGERNSSFGIVIALALAGLVHGGCAASLGAQALPPRVYSVAELREDFGVLRRALVDGDPGVYRYTPPGAMRRAFDSTLMLLDARMTAVQFFGVVAPVVALIRDGHANVRLPDTTLANWRAGELFLPFVVHVRHGRVVVFRDLSDGRDQAAGGTIESVNGLPADRLVALFLRATTGDGDVRSSRELDISGLTFAENVNLLAGLRAPFTVTIRPRGAARVTVLHFPGSARDALRDAWRARSPGDIELRTARPPTEFRLLDSARVAILTIPGWGSSQADADQRDLRGTFTRAFATMRDSGTRALIIDVRNNGGGEDEPARVLFSYIAQHPFRWYDRIIVNDTSRYSFAKYIVEPDSFGPDMLRRRADGRYDLVGESSLGRVFQPAGLSFGGAVFALMNGGSFSTSTEFVAHLKASRRATLIGEESGGAFQGNNSGFEPVLALPNTGLKLRLPLASYYMAVSGYGGDRRGVMPDVALSPTVQDEQGGADPVLDAALAIARRCVRRSCRVGE